MGDGQVRTIKDSALIIVRSDRSSGWLLRLAVALTALGCVGIFAAGADAASPAWKLLAVTGPTNLPPTQSEVQRVVVEASGGTFTLGLPGAEGEGTFTVHFAGAEVVVGSDIAKVHFAEEPFSIGERVVAPAFPPGTEITGVTGSLEEPVLELSNAATASEEFEFLETSSNIVTGVTSTSGEFHVGDEISAEHLPDGTTVTAVGTDTLTLSDYPTEPGTYPLIARERTGPLGFDASPDIIETGLEALPAIGAGSVRVSGSGTVDDEYSIAFGGNLADQNVEELLADGSALEGEHATVRVSTSVPGGAGTGEIAVFPADVGSLATSGLIEVEVGPLPTGIAISGPASSAGGIWNCPLATGEDTITCTTEEAAQPLNVFEALKIPISVSAAADPSSSASARISGGGAAQVSYLMPIVVSDKPAEAGTQAFWAGAFDADGDLEAQAGAHPLTAETYFLLNTVRARTGQIVPVEDPKDTIVDLPPGFLGDPTATPRCPLSQPSPSANSLEEAPLCNARMSVGRFNPNLSEFGIAEPVLAQHISNQVPVDGYAAEFNSVIGSPEISLFASVRTSEDYGVTVAALNIPTYDKVYGSFVALEGEPAGAEGRAFLTNPVACSETDREAPVATVSEDTWQRQGVFTPITSQTTQILPAVTGCDKLEFTPSFAIGPTTTVGSSGTGATANLQIPQANLLDPAKLAQPALKKAVVTLPAGLTLNASSANGLQACSETQMGLITTTGELPNPIRFDKAAPSCPDGSKLGTVRVKTPLLDEEEAGGKLEGTIYLAEQEKNPFGSLLALYLAIENPRYGLQIKLAGKVDLDPTTGQLTATFDHSPQLPFEELTLNLRGGGPHSELATPEVCGHYTTTGSLEPWSAPESGPPAQITEGGFDVGRGCSSSASSRPFSPTFEAGTTGSQAGAYSPLVIKVGRKDGEQELKSLDFTLPKGLVGKLTGIPYCPESAVQEAEGKSGKAEQASASCPSASQIGSVDTAAGVGSEPFHVGGKVYLAGPYKGAPLSSVVVTPAVAGPFDLGDVVIRAPLYVNPETAEITAKSDPIPTILKGIPLKVRSVAITLDRPGFTLNPTSCNVMLATASIAGSSGATASPANRFQVGGCKQLKFKPKVKISLSGATKRTGLPALKAVVTYPKQGAYANIRRAQVNLPHSEFLEQNNLNKSCTRPVLIEGKCPKTTIYGKAKAWTPLLDKPLEGPVYLVGGYGYKLPALVAELDGQIRILLKGKVDSGPNRGIRNTFEAVPDAPVSRFVLEMKGGKKYGLLINSEDLCKRQQRANVRFTAQNGLVDQTKPLIANQCGKKYKSRKKGSGHKKGAPNKH
jgi:hypothetical protein